MKRLTLLLTALALLAGCNPNDKSAATPALELKTYEVPEGAARQLRNALSDAFALKGEKDSAEWVAKATLGPDGRLVVLAPAELQKGVAEVVQKVASRPPPAPARVRMDFWLVLGKKGGGALPPELADLAAPLAEVSKAQGELQFTLLERVQVASLSGDRGMVDGRVVKVAEDATVQGELITSRIQLTPRGGNSLTTTVQLTSGQTVVLGQSGYDDPRRAPDATAEESLYYVVRASASHEPQR